jgi:hypothetical protein
MPPRSTCSQTVTSLRKPDTRTHNPGNFRAVGLRLVRMLVPAERSGDRCDDRDRQQPSQHTHCDRDIELGALGIPVTGVADAEDGDQQVEAVKGGVERRMRCYVDRWGVMSP